MEYGYDIISADITKVEGEKQICDLNDMIKKKQIMVYYVNMPKAWKLAKKDEASNAEELVITLWGVICQKNLPPLTQKPKQEKAAEYIRQQIKLAGLGCSIFERTVQILKELHGILVKQHPENSVGDLNISTACNNIAVEPATRYFTARKNDSNSQDLPFEWNEDPNGILQILKKDTHFHGEDNKVLYFNSILDNGQRKFTHADPTIFRNSDIVEVQVTLTSVAVKQNRFKTLMQLRSIALLDDSQTEKVEEVKAKARETTRNTFKEATSLKRKTGYATINDVDQQFKKINLTK